MIAYGRREGALKEAAFKLSGDIHWARADVSNRMDVEKTVQSVVEHSGAIDILVTNAGTGGLAYAVSKSGLHGLTFASAREPSKDGITVNAIAPGLITETNFFDDKLTDERLSQMVAQIPADRAGQPNDIVSAVWYLASPDASFINGEILNVNGDGCLEDNYITGA
ncbi:SDR family NAD(P)-dependent oxidoreductase [Sporolactobacillus pectinivorans]|uniref:SDR family NAD(P)-dependent oxidoreductase n=1 Tax=Sporolactobacillus pectinivorans TaxID=1591408 RepID=UPI000C25F26D|nr:SDR family oxidoreductase [Sporolactobacillus pectinivorans]